VQGSSKNVYRTHPQAGHHRFHHEAEHCREKERRHEPERRRCRRRRQDRKQEEFHEAKRFFLLRLAGRPERSADNLVSKTWAPVVSTLKGIGISCARLESLDASAQRHCRLSEKTRGGKFVHAIQKTRTQIEEKTRKPKKAGTKSILKLRRSKTMMISLPF